MAEKKKFKSEALKAIHETMEALHDIEAIDQKTMRSFNADCLELATEICPADIAALRRREGSVAKKVRM